MDDTERLRRLALNQLLTQAVRAPDGSENWLEPSLDAKAVALVRLGARVAMGDASVPSYGGRLVVKRIRWSSTWFAARIAATAESRHRNSCRKASVAAATAPRAPTTHSGTPSTAVRTGTAPAATMTTTRAVRYRSIWAAWYRARRV